MVVVLLVVVVVVVVVVVGGGVSVSRFVVGTRRNVTYQYQGVRLPHTETEY